ncbi:hypothetical protein ACX3VG_17560, partial [Escherichia coli]
EGNKVDGDQIMYIIAREGLRQGQLRGGAVGTLMSNMGLELALKQLGIPFARAKVGDRYVLEKMQEKGWRVVDCANGATYHIAPNVLRELGANVIAIGCEPNGVNINAEVGATDVRALQARVLAEKADLGIAFDGDGDRVIMVDH